MVNMSVMFDKRRIICVRRNLSLKLQHNSEVRIAWTGVSLSSALVSVQTFRPPPPLQSAREPETCLQGSPSVQANDHLQGFMENADPGPTLSTYKQNEASGARYKRPRADDLAMGLTPPPNSSLTWVDSKDIT